MKLSHLETVWGRGRQKQGRDENMLEEACVTLRLGWEAHGRAGGALPALQHPRQMWWKKAEVESSLADVGSCLSCGSGELAGKPKTPWSVRSMQSRGWKHLGRLDFWFWSFMGTSRFAP